MADSDPDERIVIEHPDIKDRSVVTRRQLTDVWTEKGFKEVKGADPTNPSPAADTMPAPVEPKSKESPKTGGSK